MTTINTYPSIFISHATKDKFITDAFIELILNLGLSIPIKEIFCSSYVGTKINTGLEWRNTVKDALTNAKIVLLFISPYYKESEMCQNEMGAAWVLNSNTIPFIIGSTFTTVGVLTEVKQISKLLDDAALDEIKDRLIDELKLDYSLIKSPLWTQKKHEFIIKCEHYLVAPENKYPMSITKDKFEKLTLEKMALSSTIKSQLSLGVTEVYNGLDEYKLKNQLINTIKTEIRICNIYIPALNVRILEADFLKAIIDNKCSFKILISDLDDENALEKRARSVGRTLANYKHGIQQNIDFFLNVWGKLKTKNLEDKLEVKLHADFIACSLWGFRNFYIVGLYLHDRPAVSGMQFRIEKECSGKKESIFFEAIDHSFNKQWASAHKEFRFIENEFKIVTIKKSAV